MSRVDASRDVSPRPKELPLRSRVIFEQDFGVFIDNAYVP